MSDVSWDLSQLDRLAVDLGKGTAKTVVETRAAVEAGALQVKNGWRDRWQGIAHAPSLPDAVTFDVYGLEAEIGPDKGRRQGALGNIVEFGTSKNGPIPGGAPALKAAVPAFEAAVTAIGVKGILG